MLPLIAGQELQGSLWPPIGCYRIVNIQQQKEGVEL